MKKTDQKFKNDQIHNLISHISEKVPAGFVSRKQLDELTGGLLKKQFLANADCSGTGISGRVKAGKTILYPLPEIERFLREKYLKAV